MNRLQKKCVIASAGCHLLLGLILLVGPAFLSSRSRPDNLPVIDFIPFKTVDALVSGGGNPTAKPPAPAPATPQPPPPVPPPAPAPVQPEVMKPPPVAKEPVKDIRNDAESLEPNKERKHTVEVSTKLVKRDAKELADATARADAQARAIADARRRAAAEIGRAVAGIESGLSGGTTIELKGPGGGGLPYANWIQAVKSVYDGAWILPSGITTDSATASATVTIARDGTVLSARIIDRSGNGAVDESVQTTLDRVKYAAPLPDDAREDQRTITIYFDVKAKLLG